MSAHAPLAGATPALGRRQPAIVHCRWGREWGAQLADKLDPTWHGVLRGLKQALDADGILHPGAGAWGSAG